MLTSRQLLFLILGDSACLFFSFFWVTILRRWEYLNWALIRDHAILFSSLSVLWLFIFYLSGLYEEKYRNKMPRVALTAAITLNFILSVLVLYFISGLFNIPVPKTILILSSFLAWATIQYWRENIASRFAPSTDHSQVLVLDQEALKSALQNGVFERLKTAAWAGLPVFTQWRFNAEKTGRIPQEHLTMEWVVERLLAPRPNRLFYRAFKRAFDFGLALLFLPMALAISFGVAFWIKIFLRESILYSQVRLGRGRKPFNLRKFRTMPSSLASAAPFLTGENDPRVPKALRWIRRLHFDEIPQILNILAGEMSWVGPRPEQVRVTDDLESKIPFYWARHVATPGITGWAQVNMGYAQTLEEAKERLAYDLYYLADQSFMLDLSILARTARNLIAADGR